MTHRRSRRPGRITPAHLLQAASLITERDRRVAVDCYEHGALTTEQITGLHFGRSRTARFRLNQTLAHRMATNEFFVRVAVEARAAGGSLREWYGERIAQLLFDGIVVPDSYGVVDLPGRDPMHLLLELDRSTEPLRRIHDKVAAYAKAIPRSELADLGPLVLFAVPAARRAAGVSAVLSSHGSNHERPPFGVLVWTESTSESGTTLQDVLAAGDASS